MDKPATILHREFTTKLVDLINSCSLPAFVIEPILDSAHKRIVEIAEQQYAADMLKWKEGTNVETEERGVQDDNE